MSGLSDKDIAILDEFKGENYAREIHTVLAEDGSWINSYVYLPNKALRTAGTWSFGDWESPQLDLFLSQDFSISGIRSPKSILSVQ